MSFVDRLRSSPPSQQLVYAAGGVVLFGVILAAAYLLLLRKPYDVLFSDLRPADAATIVADLDKRKVPYRLADGGKTILTQHDLVDATRLAVANEDLPLKGAVGFELFNKSDMGLTEFAQRINYQRALQGELARTIMTMDAVESARVHLTIADPSLFRDDRRPSKASVSIIPRPGRTLTPSEVLGVQRLIAAGVPDLSVDDVVVLDQNGDTLSGVGSEGVPVAAEDPERRAIESYYAAKVTKALATVDGASKADVAVTALVDPSPTSIDGKTAALQTWSPAARTFPLTVAISLPTLPEAKEQQQIQGIAEQAAGLDSSKGDVVTIGPARSQALAAPAQASSLSSAAPEMSPSPNAGASLPGRSASFFWEVHLLPLLLVLLGVAFVLHSRGGRRRLSEQQRARYAQRLQSILGEEGDHAASHV